MDQEHSPEPRPWADAAKEIQQLARGVSGRVHGLESRQDLEKIIGLAREIEKALDPTDQVAGP